MPISIYLKNIRKNIPLRNTWQNKTKALIRANNGGVACGGVKSKNAIRDPGQASWRLDQRERTCVRQYRERIRVGLL